MQTRLFRLSLTALIASAIASIASSSVSQLPSESDIALPADEIPADEIPTDEIPVDEPLIPGMDDPVSLDADIVSPDSPSPDSLTSACPVNQGSAEPEIGAIADQAVQVATWLQTPESGLDRFIQALGPQIVASLAPSPWPTIHGRARLAQVPVIMYHDILAEKEVFFDVTPEEFEEDLQYIQENGLTPISLDQMVDHLRTGLPLPEKPILLTFDDGYLGHYTHVFPLLQKYGYPGSFSIYTYKVGRDYGRPGVNWAQLREMAADPLVTIAAHSVTHPADLREVSDAELEHEIVESRRVLEAELGRPIHYFTYPEGKYDARVAWAVREAGYRAALTMDDRENRFAGDSQNLLAIDRIGQSQLEIVASRAWGGSQPRLWASAFDFTAPIRLDQPVMDDVPLTLISGGKPVTIHADSRYQVPEIIANTDVMAAVDGGFFSMKYLDSNTMIGPVLSQSTGEFVPGNASENPRLINRPLVLISSDAVKFVPFDANTHNSLAGIQAEMADVTDAFVGAAWLVKDGQPRAPESFGGLFDFDAYRHRAFWGVNQAGQPVIGVSNDRVDSVSLGTMLAQLGLQDAVMLDSGASTSLAYQGESMVRYVPRPVPHVVGLVPPHATAQSADCTIAYR
ncbi:MAG: polysaccharide deacetylase family protein [Elainellaceae cyanobacterium]